MGSDDGLGALLAANGLSAFAHTFAAEQITLKSAARLSESHLKELGIPMGPRMIMLDLFAADPIRPDGQAGSHGSPRHNALLKASVATPVDSLLPQPTAKKFGCFLSHHKAACAMEGETEPTIGLHY